MEKFLPNFMKKFDRYLLLRSPFMWSTRFHYLLYFWGLAALFCGAIASTTPLELTSSDTEYLILWASGIPAAIIPIVWAFQLRKFSTERSFGKLPYMAHYVRLAVYAAGAGLSLMLPLMSYQIYSQRIADITTVDVLQKENEILNIGNVFFPLHEGEHLKYKVLIQSPEYLEIAQVNDNHYNFRRFYFYDYYSTSYARYDSDDATLWKKVQAEFKKDGGKQAVEAYKAVFSKYGIDIPGSAEDILLSHKNGDFHYFATDDMKYRLSNQLYKISSSHRFLESERKYAYYWGLALIFPLALALELFSLLKLSDFFISAASFAGFVILNILMLLFVNEQMRPFGGNYQAEQMSVISYVLFIAFVVFMTAMKLGKQKTYSRFEMLSNVWSIVAMPLFGVVVYLAFEKITGIRYVEVNAHPETLLTVYLLSMAANFVFFYPKLRYRLQELLAKPTE